VDDLRAFLSSRYDEDEEFARSLVSTSAVPPAAYALGVTLAHRILSELEVGRAIVARCRLSAADGLDVVEVKDAVIRDLARAHVEHPDFRSEWRP
jgi:hypothetical protein